MKIISFCLYGANPRYCVGLIKNIELAKKLLPEWFCYVYYNNTVPGHVIDKANKFKNTKLIDVKMNDNGVFWRFFPFYENENNICISRDTDSRITEREVVCLNEWINSNKKFHIIKDHYQHYNVPIMAGLWGMKGKLDDNTLKNMQSFIEKNSWYYGKDQEWLVYLWNNFAHKDCLIHGIKELDWFKDSRNNLENSFNFIGNGWTEDDKPIYHHQDDGRQINFI